jgi:dTDP-4-amino-4,6-dideoxygalactose transaminase
MYYLILPSEAARDGLVAYLKGEGILAPFHYLPLHLSDMGRRYGGERGDCPVTEGASARLIRLPFYSGLSEEDQEDVVRAVTAFTPRA